VFEGPIIRINADELHIDDSQYYNQVYVGGGRQVRKWPPMAASYTVPESSVATVDHDLHRMRRGIMSPYFSRTAITSLEPVIHERIDRLCSRLEEHMLQGHIVNLDSAFSALTADIATCYFFGSHLDNLGGPGFKFPLRDASKQ
jgi:cytochrome P450